MVDTRQKIQGEILVTGVVDKEDSQYVSYCRELRISSCGDTIDEAFDNLGDAIEVYLEALEETGERARVFKENGIRVDIDAPPYYDEVARVPAGKIFKLYRRRVAVPVSY